MEPKTLRLDLSRGFTERMVVVLKNLHAGKPLEAHVNLVTGGRSWFQAGRQYTAPTPIALIERGLIESDEDSAELHQVFHLTELGEQIAALL